MGSLIRYGINRTASKNIYIVPKWTPGDHLVSSDDFLIRSSCIQSEIRDDIWIVWRAFLHSISHPSRVVNAMCTEYKWGRGSNVRILLPLMGGGMLSADKHKCAMCPYVIFTRIYDTLCILLWHWHRSSCTNMCSRIQEILKKKKTAT